MKNTVGLLILLACATTSFVACNDYTGKYNIADGNPTIYYVRPTNPDIADSLMTGALLGETICIVGDNLNSVQELYFNDKRAILNINLITKNTLVVTVPAERSEEITDKIYFINQAGDTTEYDFVVLMPPPSVRRIVCEVVPKGDEVVIQGDYFFDDDPDDNPLEVKIGTYTVPSADIVSIEKTKLVFKAPAEEISGNISVKTIFGTSPKSQQRFRDDRGFITGFEEGFNGGWGRPSADQLQADPAFALTGKYAVISGDLSSVDGWGGGTIINVWSQDNAGVGMTNPLFSSAPSTSILKMEVYVTTPWTGTPMTFFFAPQGDNENCLWADGTQPRGFWVPWQATGSYVSEGWETVSIPIADMKFNGAGADVGEPKAFGQLTISMHNRGMAAYDGTPCSPTILLDNIRVIPGDE